MPQIQPQRVESNVWRIPRGSKPGMNVPCIIYANQGLISKMMQDRTLIQGTNVATLQGIYKHSVVLPDGHEGYGFPIGGVAAMDAEEGVISPGGVGYDINCLPPGTSILTGLGSRKKIEVIAADEVLVCVNGDRMKKAGIALALRRHSNELVRIRTSAGYEIRATNDHPFLTPEGMIEAKKLAVGESLALCPFEGVPNEEPNEFVILEENLFVGRIAEELRKRNLIPLTSRNPRLPFLLKLLAYFTGDGTFDGKKTVFYGSVHGLKEIREDIETLEYSPSKIYSRTRETRLGRKVLVGTENSVHVSARSFTVLLKALGAPNGKKTDIPFEIPGWLFRLPSWMKRLYLAALFGAELNKPQTTNGYNFEIPQLTLTKKTDLENNGLVFLTQLRNLLGELGVETTSINKVHEVSTTRLRLLISERPGTLLKLWSRIGYEYNPSRRRLALAAVVWLRLKEIAISERVQAEKLVATMLVAGASKREVLSSLVSQNVNQRFIERSMYEGRETSPRVPFNFPRFEDWQAMNTQGDIVWDKITEILNEEFDGEVYDFTVADDSHNFVANSFVVSNCGVRLLTSDMEADSLKPVIPELLSTIFNNVPCGLGSRRRDLAISPSDLDILTSEGVRYVIEKHGLGWEQDIEHCEEKGCMKNADPSKVSPVAKRRGEKQVGTLGSGNHFLEIQRVDKIFDDNAASAFGIRNEGQVMVMIHTGSRGFGHQICSDYLKTMERAVYKYRLSIPDRELACAPADSEEAQAYYDAMACAVNYAFSNRQAITQWVRQSFERVVRQSAEDLGLNLVYDVAHNIAKLEDHQVNGEKRGVYVHRKGATRSFPAGSPDLPQDYREVGQPVLIPGSMGTSSWVMLGTPRALQLTWGSTAHGAGRVMSRSSAKRRFRGSEIKSGLRSKGIFVREASLTVLVEEADAAYKNVDEVAQISHDVGIATKVARLTPLGVVKG